MSTRNPFQWFYHHFGLASIHTTGRDAYLVILMRTLRMLAYGLVALILALFFAELGFPDSRIGLFMTLTLLGDVVLGLFLTLIADRVGRRRILFAGSVLMVLTGAVFAVSKNFWVLLGAAVVGVVDRFTTDDSRDESGCPVVVRHVQCVGQRNRHGAERTERREVTGSRRMDAARCLP
nr:putative membrane protein [Quercus suber]